MNFGPEAVYVDFKPGCFEKGDLHVACSPHRLRKYTNSEQVRLACLPS